MWELALGKVGGRVVEVLAKLCWSEDYQLPGLLQALLRHSPTLFARFLEWKCDEINGTAVSACLEALFRHLSRRVGAAAGADAEMEAGAGTGVGGEVGTVALAAAGPGADNQLLPDSALKNIEGQEARAAITQAVNHTLDAMGTHYEAVFEPSLVAWRSRSHTAAALVREVWPCPVSRGGAYC